MPARRPGAAAALSPPHRSRSGRGAAAAAGAGEGPATDGGREGSRERAGGPAPRAPARWRGGDPPPRPPRSRPGSGAGMPRGCRRRPRRHIPVDQATEPRRNVAGRRPGAGVAATAAVWPPLPGKGRGAPLSSAAARGGGRAGVLRPAVPLPPAGWGERRGGGGGRREGLRPAAAAGVHLRAPPQGAQPSAERPRRLRGAGDEGAEQGLKPATARRRP